MSAARLRHGIKVFVAQMAGHDRDRDGKGSGALGKARYHRPGPLLAGGGGQDEDRNILVLVDKLEQFLAPVALPDDPLRLVAGNAARPGGIAVKRRVGLRTRFGPNDAGDTEPLL